MSNKIQKTDRTFDDLWNLYQRFRGRLSKKAVNTPLEEKLPLDPSNKDKLVGGNTFIFWLLLHQPNEVNRFLIKNKDHCNLDHVNEIGMTPVDLALQKFQSGNVLALVEAGAQAELTWDRILMLTESVGNTYDSQIGILTRISTLLSYRLSRQYEVISQLQNQVEQLRERLESESSSSSSSSSVYSRSSLSSLGSSSSSSSLGSSDSSSSSSDSSSSSSGSYSYSYYSYSESSGSYSYYSYSEGTESDDDSSESELELVCPEIDRENCSSSSSSSSEDEELVRPISRLGTKASNVSTLPEPPVTPRWSTPSLPTIPEEDEGSESYTYEYDDGEYEYEYEYETDSDNDLDQPDPVPPVSNEKHAPVYPIVDHVPLGGELGQVITDYWREFFNGDRFLKTVSRQPYYVCQGTDSRIPAEEAFLEALLPYTNRATSLQGLRDYLADQATVANNPLPNVWTLEQFRIHLRTGGYVNDNLLADLITTPGVLIPEGCRLVVITTPGPGIRLEGKFDRPTIILMKSNDHYYPIVETMLNERNRYYHLNTAKAIGKLIRYSYFPSWFLISSQKWHRFLVELIDVFEFNGYEEKRQEMINQTLLTLATSKDLTEFGQTFLKPWLDLFDSGEIAMFHEHLRNECSNPYV